MVVTRTTRHQSVYPHPFLECPLEIYLSPTVVGEGLRSRPLAPLMGEEAGG